MTRARLRDLGLAIGTLPTGPHNAITDIAGIQVGHVSLMEDSPKTVRSGVTAIVPEDGEVGTRNLYAGTHVLNGNGEMTGLAFLNEFGLLCGPIALTSTHSVGAAHEGLIRHELANGTPFEFLLPVVAETFDGWLSDPSALAVRPHHVCEALQNARSGPVAEGNVGGGTGMICHQFKAGIGTSSRTAVITGTPWTVGVLVQANYGMRHRLSLNGRNIGDLFPVSDIPSPWPTHRETGSIIGIVATDAPLLPHQCARLAQRAALGVGRVGGMAEPSSGDLFLAFSTGNTISAADETSVANVRSLPDMALSPLFQAVIEATEESIWNALCAAETMEGWQEHVCHALPTDRLRDALLTPVLSEPEVE